MASTRIPSLLETGSVDAPLGLTRTSPTYYRTDPTVRFFLSAVTAEIAASGSTGGAGRGRGGGGGGEDHDPMLLLVRPLTGAEELLDLSPLGFVNRTVRGIASLLGCTPEDAHVLRMSARGCGHSDQTGGIAWVVPVARDVQVWSSSTGRRIRRSDMTRHLRMGRGGDEEGTGGPAIRLIVVLRGVGLPKNDGPIFDFEVEALEIADATPAPATAPLAAADDKDQNRTEAPNLNERTLGGGGGGGHPEPADGGDPPGTGGPSVTDEGLAAGETLPEVPTDEPRRLGADPSPPGAGGAPPDLDIQTLIREQRELARRIESLSQKK